MSFNNLCNNIQPLQQSYYQPSSEQQQMQNKKRRLEHSMQELEAAAQLILFNFTEAIRNPSTQQQQSFIPKEEISEIAPSSPISSIDDSDDSLHEINNNPNVVPKKKNRKRPCVLTDITHLLTLPQKEAAKILGISESMLCKRFKEQTQRKWPYRYLRKVERQISLKQKSKKLSMEDVKKLEHLSREREKCLSSVQIRLRPCGSSDSKYSNEQITSESYDSDSDEL